MAGPRMALYAPVVRVGVRVDWERVAAAESRSRMMIFSRWVFSVCLFEEQKVS
jgi:hypothetical protein